ncbi:unnamed protein product [Rhizophagus irregularis]|uniref:HTH myb-type domain-containing protein n=1 Tax=Rhizophagus irregularis TaxID=588596 RepID=A0A2N1NPY2_9GLOM|nr:hypothetical protein RhiirC2_735443 [Rhizophagus irregularis]CAB4383718.1 unnamed protein product [Rhizophagus irregularis]CAB5353349.1 unnamed protein product [Rhizophagus irregularis]
MSKVTKEPLFTKEADKSIIDCMVNQGYETLYPNNHFAEIEKVIPEYKAKRIRQRWVDKLKPGLNRDRLSKEEKEFVVQWIKKNLGPNDEIKWKDLISDMEEEFHTLRPDNIPKNYWYTLQRKLLSKISHNEELTPLQILSLLSPNPQLTG